MFKSLALALLARIGGVFSPNVPSTPDVVAAAGEVLTPNVNGRCRIPHCNADKRRARGIPHSTPGAKLARKALTAKLGVAHLR